MGITRPRVLFVSHAASRNGATILLLQELAWLRPRVDWDFEVLVYGKGALLNNFRAIARTTVWRDPKHILDAILRGRLPKLQRFVQKWCARCTLPRGRYDLVYCNTSALAGEIPHLARYGSPILWHIHELSYALSASVKADDRIAAARSTTRVVAVSEGVRDAIQSQLGISAARVDVVHGFVSFGTGQREHDHARRENVHTRLNFPPDAFVVGACGSLGWRKGSDLFLQVAARLRNEPGSFRFLWVGGTVGSRELAEFEYDARALGLEEHCHHVSDTADVDELYAAMDVFALTSREDPFPLVMLEAARHRLPLVCFKGAGGADELVAAGAGVAVPYLDVEAFAGAIARMRIDAPCREHMGLAARSRVEREHTADVQCPKLLKVMRECMPVGDAFPHAHPSPTSH